MFRQFAWIFWCLGGLGVAILIGLMISKSTIFGFMSVMLLASVIWGVTVIVAGVELFSKTAYSKYLAAASLFSIIALMSSLSFRKQRAQKMLAAANQCVQFADLYKTTHGQYPNNSDSFPSHDVIKDIFYSPNSSHSNFELSYSLDGWHRNVYRSEKQVWTAKD